MHCLGTGAKTCVSPCSPCVVQYIQNVSTGARVHRRTAARFGVGADARIERRQIEPHDHRLGLAHGVITRHSIIEGEHAQLDLMTLRALNQRIDAWRGGNRDHRSARIK